MNIYFLLLIGCVTMTAHSVQANASPALLYLNNQATTDKTSTPIGQTMSSVNFLNLIRNSIAGTSADLIVVDNLMDEDIRFLLKKTTTSTDDLVYEPSVDSAYETLTHYLDGHEISTNYFQVNDVQEALAKFLLRRETNKGSSVFLVGKNNLQTLSRGKREVTTPKNASYMLVGSACAAYFQSISVIDNTQTISNKGPVYLEIDEANSQFICNQNNSALTIIFFPPSNISIAINSIQLNFNYNNQYWMLANSTLVSNNQTYGLAYMAAPYSLETPLKYSFACTRTFFQLQNTTSTTMQLVKVSLYINNFQFQPFNVNMSMSNFTFGNVNYCQGFFSSGIWMAISASLILTFILAFGVSFLFNVKTMDRFDDPKGKPLNIAIEK